MKGVMVLRRIIIKKINKKKKLLDVGESKIAC